MRQAVILLATAKLTSFSLGLRVGDLKSQNKMEIEKVKELIFKAFKEGQKRYRAEDMPIKLWIAGVIENERI